MKPKKLACLEGVRALSCIGVVLCHFRAAFFPNSALAALICSTPLYYLFSGDTPVRVMFTLSGFVLSYKYFRTGDDSSLQRDALKRYVRLAIPTAAIILTAYVCMKLHLYYNIQAAPITGSQEFLGTFNAFEPNLLQALKEGFRDSLFQRSAFYVGPSWTMTVEMLGSYLLFAVLALLKNQRSRYVFYGLSLLAFPAYYIYFVLGMLICELYTHVETFNQFFESHPVLSPVLHILSWCYIGSITNLDAYYLRNLGFYVALTVMFLTLLNNPLLGRIWGSRPAQTVGRHSFSIYLVHWPVIESFSCAWLYYLTGRGYDHKLIVAADLLLTFAVIYGVSVLYTKWIVTPSVKLSDRIASLILDGRGGAAGAGKEPAGQKGVGK